MGALVISGWPDAGSNNRAAVWVLRAASPTIRGPCGGCSSLGGLGEPRDGEEGRCGPWGEETRFSLAARGFLPQLAASCTALAVAPSPAVCPGLVRGTSWPVSSILASHLLCDLGQVACLLSAPVCPHGMRYMGGGILPSPSCFSASRRCL